MRTYPLTYQKNIRDIGGMTGFEGKTIKYGRLFRGGALHKISDEDLEIIKSFHLTDIVDFRSDEEFTSRPDIKLDNVSYHNFPTFQEKHRDVIKKEDDGNLLWFLDGPDGHKHIERTYAGLVSTPIGIKAYTDFFNVLSQDNKVTYFHCSQGKDRAGLAAFMVEIALGVSMEDAIEDYLYSNVAMEDRIELLLEKVKDKPFYNDTYAQALRDVFASKVEYLNQAIEVMNQSGGIIKYMEDVLHVDIDRLRSLYLE